MHTWGGRARHHSRTAEGGRAGARCGLRRRPFAPVGHAPVGHAPSCRSFPLSRPEDATPSRLAGLTCTCSSVKIVCSCIWGTGVPVVTDTSRICLRTCHGRADGAGDFLLTRGHTLDPCYSAWLKMQPLRLCPRPAEPDSVFRPPPGKFLHRSRLSPPSSPSPRQRIPFSSQNDLQVAPYIHHAAHFFSLLLQPGTASHLQMSNCFIVYTSPHGTLGRRSRRPPGPHLCDEEGLQAALVLCQ